MRCSFFPLFFLTQSQKKCSLSKGCSRQMHIYNNQLLEAYATAEFMRVNSVQCSSIRGLYVFISGLRYKAPHLTLSGSQTS